MGIVLIGFINALVTSLTYGLLVMTLYLENNANCGYRCDDYFEHLPKDHSDRVFVEKPTGQLIIVKNDKARQTDL